MICLIINSLILNKSVPIVPGESSFSINQLTNNDFDDMYPLIHDGIIVWHSFDGHDTEIFMNDGTTTIQLTYNEYDELNCRMHDGIVVWESWDGHDTEIFMYDGTSTIQLTYNEYNDRHPDIHNGIVVWEEWKDLTGNGEGSGGYETEIFLQLDETPQTHNGWVTWQGYETIFIYDGNSIFGISAGGSHMYKPQIHEGMVTWGGHDIGVYLYDGITVTQLSTVWSGFHQIHDGIVVWASWDGHDTEIFMYDGTSTIQLTDNEYHEFWSCIHDDIVVWEGWPDDSEIYMAIIEDVSISVSFLGSLLPTYSLESWLHSLDEIVTAKIASSASIPIEVEIIQDSVPVSGCRVYIQENGFDLGITDENGIVKERLPIMHPPREEDFKVHIIAEIGSSTHSTGLETLYSSDSLGTLSIEITEDEMSWYPLSLLLHYLLNSNIPAPSALGMPLLRWLPPSIKTIDLLVKLVVNLMNYNPRAGDILNYEAFEYTASGGETAYALYLTIERNGEQVYEETQWTDRYELVEFLDLVQLAREAITGSLASPANFWVTAPDGRHSGINPQTGELLFEFPMAITSPDEEHQILVIPDPLDGEYTFSIVGTQGGNYEFSSSNIDENGHETDTFAAYDIPTASGTIHQYTIDWVALSHGEEGVTVQIDISGDGVFEKIVTSDGVFTLDEFMLQTMTTIDIDPDTLNLNSGGKVITVYIEPPEGYDVTQIDVSSIKINRVIPASTRVTETDDFDGDGVLDLMVKFEKASVVSLFREEELPGFFILELSGTLNDICFRGADVIRVIDSARETS
jgi:hypothetical protein